MPQPDDVQKATAYAQLIGTLGQIGAFAPGKAGEPPRMDPMWFVKRFAESMGVRNMTEAEIMPKKQTNGMIPPEVLQAQDEALMNQVQQGNLVPAGGVA